ncbi:MULTISPECIES: hypothetical protein [Peptostreptococcales]|jgi:hypothetical protein|uniref:Plasmid segregation centromere-binding protein ParR n=2 Tax=Peptostreptococcales TaxID=3082720 RepID=A0A1M6M8D9_PARC5|nr:MULTISPECIES: hypothetical protein [Peptostreptococcales]SHH13497.1 hypothetical protein SAMN02744040_00951 [Tepidibacter thalassicus DSM 15285]SHJ79737.1 hypothetical protein SAMN02745912_01128 [Paramaledivibacter caminithermalis DSM 15212]
MSIQRINLAFNLDDKDSEKAYKIIKANKGNMTNFVVNIVLAEDTRLNEKRIIKEAVREVLEEVNWQIKSDNSIEENLEESNLPDDVLDIFNNL